MARFSTADVHPREAFDYWHEHLCKKLVRHDCTPETRQAFQAELWSAPLAGIEMVRYTNTPMFTDLTARHAASANPDVIFIRLQTTGTFIIEQDGNEMVVEEGDVTLIDPRRPIRARYLKGSRQLVLRMPRRQLEARIGDVRPLVARAIKPVQGPQGLTSAYLAMLPAHVETLGAAAAAIVKTQLLDLIAISLAKAMGETPRISSARSFVRVAVRAAIEARLADPALDSEAVAGAAGVSVRYANAVLAEDGTSIMRFIRARRLEQCRRALDDPAQAHRRVSEIAYGWGFSDMTHFGRSFRAAFGSLPREYRKRAKDALRASATGR